MANRGVTQDQVHAAADALVAAGERPTVERVRAFLGSGSPNTVTRLLEGWWQTLGGRLAAQHSKVALPEAPPAVAVLASQLWEQALRAAHADSATALEHERTALARDQATLADERATLREEADALRMAADLAKQAQALAEARLIEAQRLIEHQTQQLADLSRQREALAGQCTRLEHERAGLVHRLQQQETTAATERETHAQHVRAVEDRAHAEIDRARQETKELRSRLGTLERERTALEQRWRQQQEDTHAAVAAAQREATAQGARAEALEQQLARLGDLPATLQATLATARSPRRAPKASAERARKPTRTRS